MDFIRKHPAVILVLISILPLLSLLTPGLPLTHDGQDHVARIANFHASLSEGNIVPRWASNLNWGYGHPVMMFLYPFSSYVASMFHFLGFSLVDSTKLVFASAYVASMLAMFVWLRAESGNKRIAFLGAVFYGFAPYRFVDLYVRGAIGEHMAFVWPPLICYFLLQLSDTANRKSKFPIMKKSMYSWIGAGVTMACLILSHNALALLFLPLIVLYAMYLFRITKYRLSFAILTASSLFLGFSLSAFYWLPAFFEGKYTLRDIVTGNETLSRFVPLSRFFYSHWNYGGGDSFTKEIGLLHWFGIVLAAVSQFSIRDRRLKVFTGSLTVLFFASLILMTSYSAIVWRSISILRKFQFPWRILSVSVFISAIISAYGIETLYGLLRKKIKVSGVVFLGIILFIQLAITSYMWKPKSYLQKAESFYTDVYNGTTDTGESSPIWSVRFMENRPSSDVGIDSGTASIHPAMRSSVRREYMVEAKGSARLVENTLYFPGWKIYVDGVETGIQYQDPKYRGLMTFWVQEGKHTVSVIFRETKLRMLSDYISLMALAFTCFAGLLPFIWQKKFGEAS